MWWAAGVRSGRSSKTVGVAGFLGLPLNRKTANADGGPAADGFAKNLKQLVAEHERVEGRGGCKSPEPDHTFLRSRP